MNKGVNENLIIKNNNNISYLSIIIRMEKEYTESRLTEKIQHTEPHLGPPFQNLTGAEQSSLHCTYNPRQSSKECSERA